MKSPWTGEECELRHYTETTIFKGEEFVVNGTEWVCPTTKETFVTIEQGDANIGQIYDQYKVKHPEWIHPKDRPADKIFDEYAS